MKQIEIAERQEKPGLSREGESPGAVFSNFALAVVVF